MLSLHNIRSIALYETKTLFRSWFFRIFAIVALLVMLGFNMVCIRFWSYKSSPAMIPWCNLVFLNVVQAIIAVFLASDFLKRDKKLDTTEVIYIRPMTNAEYVIGKLLGNLVVFFVLNLLILGMGLIFNSIAQHTYIEWAAYLYYFLLMSLPTLIYIFGLSFFVMSLIRNQAVTFIILLGYIAITLFYLKSNLYYLFDYMSFHVPMFYSDITGFGELNKLLVHRGLYLMLGMSLVCFTIAMLQRLPNASGSPKKAAVCGLLFFVAAAWLGYRHVSASLDDYRLRAQMQTLNDSYADVKTVDVTDYNLDVTHSGSTLTITAVLDVENTDDIPLPKLVFSLNPGLTLTGVMDGEKPLDFERKLNIIELAVELQPAETRRLTFTYAGTINEAACFLDATDE
ncbi:MAG: ABC transporter permease, partial [Bacteroidales bacterium]|nr:ABC transporter permease [Bacteroidales bacterium]